jgi:hypothetical protein
MGCPEDWYYKYNFIDVLQTLNSNWKGTCPLNTLEEEQELVRWLEYRLSCWQPNKETLLDVGFSNSSNYGVDIHFYNAAVELVKHYKNKYSLELYE